MKQRDLMSIMAYLEGTTDKKVLVKVRKESGEFMLCDIESVFPFSDALCLNVIIDNQAFLPYWEKCDPLKRDSLISVDKDYLYCGCYKIRLDVLNKLPKPE